MRIGQKQGEHMWGVSLGDYVIYWIGLIVITIGAVIASIVSRFRQRGKKD